MAEEAKRHIEFIRKEWFSIGADQPSPRATGHRLAADALHEELHSSKLDALLEIFRNAGENEYPSGAIPSLEFVITVKDIMGAGVSNTLLVFNNEVGFSKEDIEAICSIRQSKKTGKMHHRGIRVRGVGFKSLFDICKQPCIFSNGYQIRFHEEPNQDCQIRYIVPEWIDARPYLFSDIEYEYGSKMEHPMTIIALPLEDYISKPLRKSLFLIHPESILFFNIGLLSVRQGSSCPKLCLGALFSICFTKGIVTLENNLERVSACEASLTSFRQKDNGDLLKNTCEYYIWTERFSFMSDASDKEGASEYVISIALPFGQRPGKIPSPSVFYSFPAEGMPELPYLVYSEFEINPARPIILDNYWNLQILANIPMAFRGAFVSSIRNDAKNSFRNVGHLYKLLTLAAQISGNFEGHDELALISKEIEKLVKESPVVPCESFSDKEVYSRPSGVTRLLPQFRKILNIMMEQGTCFEGPDNIKLVLHSSLDTDANFGALNLLGVAGPWNDINWYPTFIHTSNLMSQASEDVYLDILCFLFDFWDIFCECSFLTIPIIKYVMKNKEHLCTIQDTTKGKLKLFYASRFNEHVWIDEWWSNYCAQNMMFLLPRSTQKALMSHKRRYLLCAGLEVYASVTSTTVRDYSTQLIEYLRKSSDRRTSILLPFFLYESLLGQFISKSVVHHLCSMMPIIDGCGCMHVERVRTLVPACCSKWAKLFHSNPYIQNKYIDLGTAYEEVPIENFLGYMSTYTEAVDLPDLAPPDIALSVSASPLTAELAFLLLEWLDKLQEVGTVLPPVFIRSIKEGNWLKTISGFNSPVHSFIARIESSCSKKDDVTNAHVIDEEYYGRKIWLFEDVLYSIGVRPSP